MERVDWDAVQAEADGDAWELSLRGEVYVMPAGMPPSVIRFLAPGPDQDEASFMPDFVAVARMFVGPDKAEAFADSMTMGGWMKLFDRYGMALGESLGSPALSGMTGEPSKPTSPSSTDSISPTSQLAS